MEVYYYYYYFGRVRKSCGNARLRLRVPFSFSQTSTRVLIGSVSNDDDDPWKKLNLYFTSEIRDYLELFGTSMAFKTYAGLICDDDVQFQMEIRKISRRRPRSVDDAELGHFKLLFCRGRQ